MRNISHSKCQYSAQQDFYLVVMLCTLCTRVDGGITYQTAKLPEVSLIWIQFTVKISAL